MSSALQVRYSALDSNPSYGHVPVQDVFLFPTRYKNGIGELHRWGRRRVSEEGRGGVVIEILQVATCCGNGYKHQPDGSLGFMN